ncbi:hypothetical protein [Sphingomonas sanxanigenens]|uniref:hypothetical protein n=1 Tax=Sphingomonas sanxanigenens TaxID=397260 RepID=UPI0013015A40|nr:hypothetical protein [Sphingomonas sanxanigenens]
MASNPHQIAPAGTLVIEVLCEFRNDLRIYDAVPACFDVIKVGERDACPLLHAGEVAIYDPSDCIFAEGLIDGAIYVMEHQRPVAGMSWETFHRTGSQRVAVDRRLVRAQRSSNDRDLWFAQPLRRRFAGAFQGIDPAQPENLLQSKFVGRVVGLFRPNMEA